MSTEPKGHERGSVFHLTLRCIACGKSFPHTHRASWCTSCEAALDVEYSVPLRVQEERRDLPGIWSHRGAFPLADPEGLVSLGEGNTPSVPLPRVGAHLGLGRLYAKLEYLNPTGSFKDRGSAALASALRDIGVTEIIEDSSGNAGASIAAYAARAGLRAAVFVPETAPLAKVRQIAFYGAQVRRVPGGRQAAAQAAREASERRGIYHASHNLNPFFLEGMVSFALEVAQQFPDGLPDHILFPVGNGSLLIGAWKGLLRLREAGAVRRLPRLYAVQGRRVQPLVAAFHNKPWQAPERAHTVAGGIAVTQPPRLRQALAVLRDSGGSAVAVAERDILAWQKALAVGEGIFCEPTSAAAFAGLEALVQRGLIGHEESVLVPVTGFGLKDRVPAARSS
ncbi:MAG: threonine synthase [Chloroflexi bacterium]|nr:threonine synthase [Chloroflexota bacterium]